jgi:hypothetical protein
MPKKPVADISSPAALSALYDSVPPICPAVFIMPVAIRRALPRSRRTRQNRRSRKRDAGEGETEAFDNGQLIGRENHQGEADGPEQQAGDSHAPPGPLYAASRQSSRRYRERRTKGARSYRESGVAAHSPAHCLRALDLSLFALPKRIANFALENLAGPGFR